MALKSSINHTFSTAAPLKKEKFVILLIRVIAMPRYHSGLHFQITSIMWGSTLVQHVQILQLSQAELLI